MTVSRKKEMCDVFQSIQVHAHSKCLVLNIEHNIDTNELFEFKDYKKFLNKCKIYVNDKNIKIIKEYLNDNCPEVKWLMDIDNGQNQLSLF